MNNKLPSLGFRILSLGFVLWSGCIPMQLPLEMGNPKWGVDVTWHGHSCFSLRDSLGRTIVIDPFDETVGYGRLFVRADAVLVTHDHFDHNYIRAIRPRLQRLDIVSSSDTIVVAGGVEVRTIRSFHDEEKGSVHGPNRIYAFQMGGLRVVHLGDLGQTELTPTQIGTIGKVDVLFVPVGGITTIDAARAKAIIDVLQPKAVFPMHYGDLRFYRLASVTAFTSMFEDGQKIFSDADRVRIRAADLTEHPLIYVLKPSENN